MVLSLLSYGTVNGQPGTVSDGLWHSHYSVMELSVVGHSTINDELRDC